MSSPVPVTRTLTAVLRRQLNAPAGARLVVGKVTAIPDARHVTLEIEGAVVTVPRLTSYTPVVGKAAYCLADETTLLAIGGVT